MLYGSTAFAGYLAIDRAVLDIETFRNANEGALPEKLAELTACNLPIPTDPITNRPLKYRRTREGYIIYSVGINGVDDGGTDNPGNVRRKPLDFVLEVRIEPSR